MQAKIEKATDHIIASLLEKSNITYDQDNSRIAEIQNALSSASKNLTGKKGSPDFIAYSGDFVMVIEDKNSLAKQAKLIDGAKNTLLMNKNTIPEYAENGALHYAMQIVNNTNFKKVFAFGASGTESDRMCIRPIFVSPAGYKRLDDKFLIQDFSFFAESEIERFYQEKVLEKKTQEQREVEEILAQAKELHESLRNYGQLGDSEKPLVVSAILLALAERDFSTENLTGDSEKTDGQKIFDALTTHMKRVKVEPTVKKDRVIDQFRLIVNRPHLSKHNENLGKSPLKFFAEYLNSHVYSAICSNTPEDVLGRFYGEFIRYSGGDGQTLGVVLTPRHITQLFTELLDIKPCDVVFDPCCGTGGFLIAAMSKMLSEAKSELQKTEIKKKSTSRHRIARRYVFHRDDKHDFARRRKKQP